MFYYISVLRRQWSLRVFRSGPPTSPSSQVLPPRLNGSLEPSQTLFLGDLLARFRSFQSTDSMFTPLVPYLLLLLRPSNQSLHFLAGLQEIYLYSCLERSPPSPHLLTESLRKSLLIKIIPCLQGHGNGFHAFLSVLVLQIFRGLLRKYRT